MDCICAQTLKTLSFPSKAMQSYFENYFEKSASKNTGHFLQVPWAILCWSFPYSSKSKPLYDYILGT